MTQLWVSQAREKVGSTRGARIISTKMTVINSMAVKPRRRGEKSIPRLLSIRNPMDRLTFAIRRYAFGRSAGKPILFDAADLAAELGEEGADDGVLFHFGLEFGGDAGTRRPLGSGRRG